MLLLPLLIVASTVTGSLEAGVGRVDITPRGPIRLGGYSARQHASTSVAGRLWAKALAVRDERGGRVVIVTMDLLRAPRILTDAVAAEAARRYGLARAELVFNASHTHSGPLLWEDDPFPSVPPDDYEECRRYVQSLIPAIADLVGSALRDLAPAAVSFGRGTAAFAANRRLPTAEGYQIAYNATGPVDHRVPVMQVTRRDGRLLAILFGYACHNTAIGPASYSINGDYAGVAQELLEREHPGATALFLQLAAGDQDPYPRGEPETAARHGKALAEAVERTRSSARQPLAGPLGTAFRILLLPFAPHSRATFEARLNDANPARVRNARAMLKAYDEGHPVVSLEYPVQAVSFGGSSLTLVALGGEPVIDYALRAKRELPDVVLAGYSNSVRGYIPSERVLAEGGYEGGDSAPYYGLPGPFAPGVEETIFGAIRAVLQEAARTRVGS